MAKPFNNDPTTRSEIPLRVVSSSKTPDAVMGVKRAKQSNLQIKTETAFRRTITIIGLAMVVLVLGIMLTLIVQSVPAIQKVGFGFVSGRVWDHNKDLYGSLPLLVGTLVTAFFALTISIPFSYSIAIVLGEYFPKGIFSNFLKNMVDLIAAVPSVIYGFWGIFVLHPIISSFELYLSHTFHWNIQTIGFDIFTASLILGVMIIPYAASLGRSMIQMVPSSLKEAAYALGATRWEVIRSVIIPYSKSGLFAGILLSLGRALGETMAVTMVIGNVNKIPENIFSPGNTMASEIALQLGEATGVYNSALIELGLLLFIVTVIINIIGKKIIDRFAN